MFEANILQYLTNYGTYQIKLKSFAEGYVDSDDVYTSFTITGATIGISNQTIVKVKKNIQGITQFELVVDGLPIDIVGYDGAETWQLDLSTYELNEGRHTVCLRAIGEGINTNESNTLYFYAGRTPIYGVSGLTDAATELTRTDDAIDHSFEINTTTGEIISDFDNVFPWNETEIVDDVAGKFVKFPEMYFRVGVDANSNITDIAVSPTEHEEGSWFRVAPFMYGCYGASVLNSKLQSVSGKARAAGGVIGTYRTNAQNNGNGYHLLDLYHHTVLSFLFWIEFATKYTRGVMSGRYSGSGTAGGSTICQTGGTDEIQTPSGFELKYKQMRYHYIEDFYGNLCEYIDGVYCTSYGSANYVSSEPSNYNNGTTNYSQTSYKNYSTSYSYPQVAALGWDSNHPFLVMPTTIINNSNFNTYLCGRNYNMGNTVLYKASSASSSLTYAGLCMFSRCGTSSSYTNLGARLLKQINEN